MDLRWTEESAADLESIAEYLFENSSRNAEELLREIYQATLALQVFPYRGRHGKKQGTRELVLWPLPYVVVYRIAADVIHIVRILHGAQKWP